MVQAGQRVKYYLVCHPSGISLFIQKCFYAIVAYSYCQKFGKVRFSVESVNS